MAGMTRADEVWAEMARPRSVIGWRSGRRLRAGEEFTTSHIRTTWRVVRVRHKVRGREGCRGFCTGVYDVTLADANMMASSSGTDRGGV
jgi:hypothetical protein